MKSKSKDSATTAKVKAQMNTTKSAASKAITSNIAEPAVVAVGSGPGATTIAMDASSPKLTGSKTSGQPAATNRSRSGSKPAAAPANPMSTTSTTSPTMGSQQAATCRLRTGQEIVDSFPPLPFGYSKASQHDNQMQSNGDAAMPPPTLPESDRDLDDSYFMQDYDAQYEEMYEDGAYSGYMDFDIPGPAYTHSAHYLSIPSRGNPRYVR